MNTDTHWPCLPDESVLRAHAHIIGNTGSGKLNPDIALVLSLLEARKNGRLAPCYILIDEFQDVSFENEDLPRPAADNTAPNA